MQFCSYFPVPNSFFFFNSWTSKSQATGGFAGCVKPPVRRWQRIHPEGSQVEVGHLPSKRSRNNLSKPRIEHLLGSEGLSLGFSF